MSSTAVTAKRSLKHFVVGRAATAVVGVANLLLLVRLLDIPSYGLYVGLYAIFEILQLAGSPGAFAVAYRYVAEFRTDGPILAKLVRGLLAYRAATLALLATVVVVLAGPLAAALGAAAQQAVALPFALFLLFEGVSRLNDAMFESLLRQGQAQITLFIRNTGRFAALAVLMAAGAPGTVAVVQWWWAEALIAALGAAMGVGLMLRQLAVDSGAGGQGMPLPVERMRRFALPTYLSQVAYMASNAEMVKVLVARLFGLSLAAAFGFAASVSATIQRYLPSFLLIGWIRPLFIAARREGKTTERLVEMAGTVVKLNLLVLCPLFTLFFVGGDALVHLLAGGRLPQSAGFIQFFLLLLVLQTTRAVVSMLGMTFEIGGGSLRATLWSLIGLAAGLSLYAVAGVWALCMGLAVSELIWVVVMVYSLRRVDVICRMPLLGVGKIAAATAFASALGMAVRALMPPDNMVVTIGIGVAASLVALLLTALLRPFESSERQAINRLLPLKLFVW